MQTKVLGFGKERIIRGAMKMKKMLSVIMVSILTFSLAGCGRNETDSGRDSAAADENTVSQEPAGTGETDPEPALENEPDGSETEPAATAGSNALVVYFSWSGNTENVANAIVDQTGADVFAIIPEEAYIDDYNTLLDVAAEEKESGARPAIAGNIEDISQYDIIYVGYPNWLAYHNLIQCT